MFETEGIDDGMESEDAEEPSVAVSSDTALGICPACHDTFSQFFHQETEEWRYHNATQVDGINYHPACHQDLLRVSVGVFVYVCLCVYLPSCDIHEGSLDHGVLSSYLECVCVCVRVCLSHTIFFLVMM